MHFKIMITNYSLTIYADTLNTIGYIASRLKLEKTLVLPIDNGYMLSIQKPKLQLFEYLRILASDNDLKGVMNYE